MAERKTLLSRPSDAPRVAQSNLSLPSAAFGVAPTADRSGLVNFGQGVAQAGQAAMSFAQQERARVERLERERIAREDNDTAVKVQNMASARRQVLVERIANESGAWSPEEYTSRLNAVAAEERTFLDDEINALAQKNPGAARVLTRDFIDGTWFSKTQAIVESGYIRGAELLQVSRDKGIATKFANEVNEAGPDLAKITEIARHYAQGVKGDSTLSHGLKSSWSEQVARPAMKNSLRAAILARRNANPNAEAWDQQVAAFATEAHKSNYLTTEDVEEAKALAARVKEQNRSNLKQEVDNLVASMRAGRGVLIDAKEIDTIATALHPDAPALKQKVASELALSKGLDTLVSRWNEGQFTFPFTLAKANVDRATGPEDATRAPTLDEAITLLSSGDDAKVRSVFRHIMPEGMKSDEYLAGLTTEEVSRAGADLLSRLKQQRETPMHVVASRSPEVIAALAENNTPQQAVASLKAWYDSNHVPNEKRTFFFKPHLDRFNQFVKEGRVEEAVQELEDVSMGYAEYGRFSVADALAKDPSTRRFAAVAAMLAQAPLTSNEARQKQIREDARTIFSALSADLKEVKDLSTARGDVDWVLRQIGVSRAGKEDDPGDQTYANLITALQAQSPAAAQALDEAVRNTIIYKAHGPNGSGNVALEAQRVMNTLGSAFMLVRANGTYSENPQFMLHVPSSGTQDFMHRALFGPEPGVARSTADEARFTSMAYDSILADGLNEVSYRSLGSKFVSNPFFSFTAAAQFPLLAKLDNAIAQKMHRMAALRGWDGPLWRASGIENVAIPFGSADIRVLTPEPYTSPQLPENLKVPMDGVYLADGNPVARSPLRIAGTALVEAQRIIDEEYKKSPATDDRSMNQLVLLRNHRWVEIPGGQVQLFLVPTAPSVGNVPSGLPGTPAPVFKKDKAGELVPIVLKKSDIEAHSNRLLRYLADPSASNGTKL